MSHPGNRHRQYFAFAFFAVTPMLIAVDLEVLPLSVAWIAAVLGFRVSLKLMADAETRDTPTPAAPTQSPPP